MKLKKFFIFISIFVICLFITGCNSNIKDNGDTVLPDINDNNESSEDKKPQYKPPYDKDLKVYFINVGQGDCSLAILPNGMTVLTDAGLDHDTCFGEANFPSWDNIKKIFDMENISVIDYFIITHYHMDHYKYAETILRNYTVKNMVLSGSTSTNYSYYTLMKTINELKTPVIEAKVGMDIIEEPSITLEVVATQKLDNPENCNICSVCTKLTYNENSFLFMGDAGFTNNDGEYIAMNSGINLRSDVLKVGHHGSSRSSGKDFLNKVKPSYAVITTSSITNTGHPHQSAINRIKLHTSKILQSKDDGTILFSSNGKKLEYITHVGE